MVLPSAVLHQTMLAFEPFGALHAIPSPESWQIFDRFCCFMLREMLGGAEVCMHLIKVPSMKS